MLISLTNLNELSQENCYNSYSVHAWILHRFDHFKISILQGESYFSLLKFDSEEQKWKENKYFRLWEASQILAVYVFVHCSNYVVHQFL